MITTSAGFKHNLLNDNRNYKYFIDITLSDGKILNITNSDLWQRTFRIEDSVSQDNNLDVGDAIINKLSFSLNNIDESYSEYDFTDAELVAYIALDVDGELEKLKKFTGVIDETIYNGSLISITAFDNMSKADKDFDTSGIKFPVSIGELILYCATKMGIPLETVKFPNMDFVIQSLPNDSTSAVTYRQVISWCSQICGCFARCNRNGELEIKWYNTECLIEQFADGGTFNTTTTPYSDGDSVDGGTFNTTTTPYSDGASVDAGVFTSIESPHFFTGYSSHNIGVDDVVVTGVSVKTKERDSESASSGSSGYIIAIENNPFVTENNKQAIADFLGKWLIGIKFRTLTASVLSDPSVEAGDVGFFYALNHNYYPVLVSSVTFSAGGYMKIRSSAKTPARNKAVTYSEETRNYVDLRNKIAAEKTLREIQEEKLNDALNSSAGLYTTIEKGNTGNIYYFHNHKDLSDSDIVWKMTSEAWGVSTDGGKTWNGGMTVDGDTITRILTATGINADWIKTGKIQDTKSKNYWDMNTGEFQLASTVTVGGKTVSKIASDAVNAQTQRSIFNKLTNNGQTQGIYLSDGKLYVNASYIGTGELCDKSRNTVFNLSTGTFTMKKGSINIGGGRFVVDSSGYLTARGVSLSGSLRTVSGSTFTELYNGILRAGYTSGGSDTIHGTFDASAQYEGNQNCVSLLAKTGFLVLGGTGTIWFTDNSGTGYAWGWVNSDGLHSKNGANISSVKIPSSIRSDGTVEAWYSCSIVDGIVK